MQERAQARGDFFGATDLDLTGLRFECLIHQKSRLRVAFVTPVVEELSFF